MKIALVGLGHLGYATLQRLLELGTEQVIVIARSTPQTEAAIEALRSAHPGTQITQHHTFSADLLDQPLDACILAADSTLEDDHLVVNQATVRAGVPFIAAIGMGDVVHVGPRIEAGHGPCLQCIDIRVQAARSQPAFVGPYPPNPELLSQAGGLVCDYLTSHEVDADAVTYLWSHGGRTESHALRVRTCTACALVEPTPAFARPTELDLAGGPTSDKNRIRQIENMIVDPVMGTVRSVTAYEATPTEPQIAHAVASIADPIWAQYGQDLNGGGNDLAPDTAYAAALGEALDRVATTQPAREHLLVAPYSQVQSQAIDPLSFDMFDKRTRDITGFPYVAVSHETPLSWAWGWSMARQRSVLVPASRVFVPMAPVASSDSQHHTNVTGCATGSSRADAALGGLLEVVERDTFMITWANGLPLTGLHIDPTADTLVGQYAASFDEVGIDVRCVVITLDWGVPVVIAMAKSPHPGDPAIVIAASADPDLASACSGALKELTANLAFVRPLIATATAPQQSDPSQVRDQHGHALLYARADMAATLEPWWNPNESMDVPEPVAIDSLEALNTISRRICDSGNDVIVVDVSIPGLDQQGILTYKVLVPGAYPMNFDALWPEWGGRRMTTAAVSAGILECPRTFHELVAQPHPFP